MQQICDAVKALLPTAASAAASVLYGKDQDEGEQREEGRTLTLASARTLFLNDQKKIAKRIISIFLRRCKMSKNRADIS